MENEIYDLREVKLDISFNVKDKSQLERCEKAYNLISKCFCSEVDYEDNQLKAVFHEGPEDSFWIVPPINERLEDLCLKCNDYSHDKPFVVRKSEGEGDFSVKHTLNAYGNTYFIFESHKELP